MNNDPLDLARRHIVETKRLLETLITSSESFDYVKAKMALKELEKKGRELSKLEARLNAEKTKPANVRVIHFGGQEQEAQGQ